MLLDDVIAGEPGEVVPVADLPLHVAPGRITVNDPDLAAVPVCLGVEDVADRPILDPLDRLLVALLMSPLRSGRDTQALLRGQLAGLDHHPHPRRIDGPRLLHERVLAGSMAALRWIGRKWGGVARIT